MTIAEKITRAKVDYDEVYVAGQKSMVDESKLIEKTVSGVGKVSLTDVSEIPHKIKVQLSSDTVTDFSSVKIKRTGANLIPFPYKSGGIGTVHTHNGVTFTVNEDRSISIKGTAEKQAYFGLVKDDFGNKPINAMNVQSGTNGEYSVSKRLYYNEGHQSITVNIASGDTVDETIYPMCNAGAVVLPYEPYQEDTYTPSVDGYVEVVSSSPNTTISTDNADIKITAMYYKSYGMQTEYDKFWDNYQQNGERTDYRYAFGGFGWTNYVFKPKYDITPVETFGNSMFYCCGVRGNLVKILDDLGVKLDCSKATTFGSTFNSAYYITRIGAIGNENVTSIANCFIYCSGLVTIDEVIVNENTIFTNTFQSCGSLKNITFEGTIGQSINFQWSPLTPESMISVITHLANYAGTDNEGKYTVRFTDACWEALEAHSTAPDGNSWRDYTNDTLGWLI